MKTIRIDCKNSARCERLYARRTWQVLFDLYRKHGGDLAHMDSILCDLYMLTNKFKERRFKIYWGFTGSFTELSATRPDLYLSVNKVVSIEWDDELQKIIVTELKIQD